MVVYWDSERDDQLKKFIKLAEQLKLSFDGSERNYLLDTMMHRNWDDRVFIEGKENLGMSEFQTLNEIVAETAGALYYITDDSRREVLKKQKTCHWIALSQKGFINTMEFPLDPPEELFPKIQRAIEKAGKYAEIQASRVPEYHRMLMAYTGIGECVPLLDGALDDVRANLIEGRIHEAERQRDAFMMLVSSAQNKYDIPVATTQDICAVLMAAKHTAIDELIECASKAVENKEDPRPYCIKALAIRDFKFQPAKLPIPVVNKEPKQYASRVEERVLDVTKEYEKIKSS